MNYVDNITTADVKQAFPNASRVERVHSQQLFEVYYDNKMLLVSYLTVVGLHMKSWYITTECYSVSTTRQLNRYIRENGIDYTSLSEDTLHRAAKKGLLV